MFTKGVKKLMATKLFVGGLAWGTTEEAMNSMFAEAGSVLSAVIIKDKFTNRSKGFGFVEMSSQEEADKAVEMFNGKELDGRPITVNEARPMEPRENRGGSDRRY